MGLVGRGKWRDTGKEHKASATHDEKVPDIYVVTTVSNTVIKYLIFAKRVGLRCSYQKKSKKEGRKERGKKKMATI